MSHRYVVCLDEDVDRSQQKATSVCCIMENPAGAFHASVQCLHFEFFKNKFLEFFTQNEWRKYCRDSLFSIRNYVDVGDKFETEI